MGFNVNHHESNVNVSSPISDHIPSDYHNHDHYAKRHLLGGIVTGISTVLLVSLLYYLIKAKLIPFLKKRSQSVPIFSNKKGNLKDEKTMLRKFELDEVLKATKSFSEESLLGSGAFGNVYKAVFEVEGTLAIKRPHAESCQSVEEFRNEVRLLSRIRHRNLVGLVGFCEEPGPRGSKMLVYEYVPNGSLLEYITGKRGKTLSWSQRATIAIGAAKGIAHLHEEIRPSIIHRDIKPSNILVGEGFEAKVCDFGLVKSGPTGDQSHVSSQVKGTPGYLDPAYCSTFQLTTSTDVFSFGVILLQLLTARPATFPHSHSHSHSHTTKLFHPNHHIIEWARPSLERGKVEDIIDVKLLSEQCNMKMMLKMGQLGLRCVVDTPKLRPTMSQVWQELQEAFNLAQSSVINKNPSLDYECSQSQSSFVSINGIGFQRFHVEMESLSIHSTVLRGFEDNTLTIDVENGIYDEKE